MKIELRNNKGFLSGVMFIGIGALAMYISRDYPMGSALRIGHAGDARRDRTHRRHVEVAAVDRGAIIAGQVLVHAGERRRFFGGRLLFRA